LELKLCKGFRWGGFPVVNTFVFSFVDAGEERLLVTEERREELMVRDFCRYGQSAREKMSSKLCTERFPARISEERKEPTVAPRSKLLALTLLERSLET
jgi:hypothetical protein